MEYSASQMSGTVEEGTVLASIGQMGPLGSTPVKGRMTERPAVADREVSWALKGSTPVKGRMIEGPAEVDGRLGGASGGRTLWKEG